MKGIANYDYEFNYCGLDQTSKQLQILIKFLQILSQLNRVMDEQSLRSNAVAEDFFKIGVKCISLCQTEFVDEVSAQQKLCLENCGYNRAYLVHNFKALVQKAVNFPQ